MARRVFISVLGTGFYKKCRYCKDTFISSETRFIQQALMEYHNIKSWNGSDRIFILLTDKAKSENWDITDGDPLENFASVSLYWIERASIFLEYIDLEESYSTISSGHLNFTWSARRDRLRREGFARSLYQKQHMVSNEGFYLPMTISYYG